MNTLKNTKKKLIILGVIVLTLILLGIKIAKFKSNSKPTTLVIWHTEVDPKAQEQFNQTVKAFQHNNPSVNVEVDAVAWGQLSQKLVTALASGEVPDLTHLEPFMTASLYKRNQLLPIDDVIEHINEKRIFPAVRHLQYFDNHFYGIAYAIGTTFFAVRRDLMDNLQIEDPKTWKDYIDLAKKLTIDQDNDGIPEVYGIVLPGTPFFIDQFSIELVASNGGRLFDDAGKPNFKDKSIIQMLEFWRDISQYAPPAWTGYTYLEQFQLFAAGKVAMVPVFYARALKNIENDASTDIADPEHFDFIPQPVGPSGTIGFSTMDCENWSILKAAKNPDMAREFLKFFYDEKNYLPYCQAVPIHLTPCLKDIAESTQYLNTPMIKRWQKWQNYANEKLASGQAYPILMSNPNDKYIPYLMELQGRRIITDMVLDVCVEGLTPEAATERAQNRAMKLYNEVGFKQN